MKYAALVLVALSACAVREIPEGAVSMEGWAELDDARQEWADRGLPNAGNCFVPYIVAVDTATFEAHWRETGGDAARVSCARGRTLHCVDLYTDITEDPSPAVVYTDAANPMSVTDRANALHHELFHVLRQCHEGSPDQMHTDRVVWSGDVFANN